MFMSPTLTISGTSGDRGAASSTRNCSSSSSSSPDSLFPSKMTGPEALALDNLKDMITF